jgi:hypothetical protein
MNMQLFMKKSLPQIMIKSFFPSLALIGLLAISSCNTDPVKFGIDLIPSGDKFAINLNTDLQDSCVTKLSDTIAVHSIYYNSKTSQYYLSDSSQLLGNYHDGIFGRKMCDMLYQVFPTDTTPAYNTDLYTPEVQADSLILVLKVDSVLLGNRNESQEYEIYELAKNINYSTTYYSSTDYSTFKGNLIGSGTFTLNNQYIRIPINNIGTGIMNRLYFLSGYENNTDTIFTRIFKGFYIVGRNNGTNNGAIYKIASFSNSSKLFLYFKRWKNYAKGATLNGVTLTNDTIVLENKYKTYTTGYLQSGATFISHNYESSQVQTNPNHVFVQGAAGPYAQINILNTYNTWKDSGYVAFNKVLLELTPDNEYLAGLGITPKDYPSTLQIYFNDSIYYNEITHGVNAVGKTRNYLIGYYDKIDGVYRFNITPVFQRIVKENPENTNYINRWNNLDLYIKDLKDVKTVQGTITGIRSCKHSGGRVAFNKNNGIKLKVTYSIIK